MTMPLLSSHWYEAVSPSVIAELGLDFILSVLTFGAHLLRICPAWVAATLFLVSVGVGLLEELSRCLASSSAFSGLRVPAAQPVFLSGLLPFPEL